MYRYTTQLAKGAEKGSYRERPIETAEKVQELSSKSRKQKTKSVEKEKAVAVEKTPRNKAVFEARRKAGLKAFKEATKEVNYKLNALLYKKEQLKQRGINTTDIDKEIQELISKNIKIQELEKEAEMLKDEPLKYLAKLQEIKAEQDKETAEKLRTELSGVKGELEISQLLQKLNLKPEQELLLSDEYRTLPKNEKEFVVKALQQMTHYKVAKRRELVKKFLAETPENRTRILEKSLEGMSIPAIAEEFYEIPMTKKDREEIGRAHV